MEGDGGRAGADAGAPCGSCRGRSQRGERAPARPVRLRPARRAAREPAPDRPGVAVRVVRLQARGLLPAGPDRVAEARRDHHARRLRRTERPGRLGGRRVVRRRLRSRPGPARGARAVPARDAGPPRRGARREPSAGRHRGPPRLLHAEPVAPPATQAAGLAAGPLRRLRRGRQRLDPARRRRPVAAAARVRAAQPHARALEAAGLGHDWRPARPHRAVGRRAGARELARAARARREALRPLPAAAPARDADHRARLRRSLPVPARPHAGRRAPRLQGLAALPQEAAPAEGRARHGARGRPPARPRRLLPLRAARPGEHGVAVLRAAARLLDPRAVRGVRGPRSRPERARRHRPRHPRDRGRPQRADRVGDHERARRRRRPLRRAGRRQEP